MLLNYMFFLVIIGYSNMGYFRVFYPMLLLIIIDQSTIYYLNIFLVILGY
jgi:hypothetical protein